ncbi:MAG: acyl--CoA ligase, partial [Candidatus Methanomethylophilaceae archaeon]|nr:acyl--CoA ligase [Candidatus Methanomethylophilaceae archaeon]
MLLEDALEKYADQTALRFRRNPSDPEAESMTFREFEAYVRDLSTQLHCEGLEGQFAALVGEASPEWFFTYYASMSSGLVLVPIDREMPEADIAGILNKVGCTILFFSPSVAKKCMEVLSAAPCVTTPIVMGELPEDMEIPGCRTMQSLREAGAEEYAAGNRIFYDYEIDNNSLASVVFTSGTTGKGK